MKWTLKWSLKWFYFEYVQVSSYGNCDGLCYAEYSSSKPTRSLNILSAVLFNCTLMPKGSLRVRHTPIVMNMGFSLSKISHTGLRHYYWHYALVVMYLFETWNTWMQGHSRRCLFLSVKLTVADFFVKIIKWSQRYKLETLGCNIFQSETDTFGW